MTKNGGRREGGGATHSATIVDEQCDRPTAPLNIRTAMVIREIVQPSRFFRALAVILEATPDQAAELLEPVLSRIGPPAMLTREAAKPAQAEIELVITRSATPAQAQKRIMALRAFLSRS